jgi:hypothetical protein
LIWADRFAAGFGLKNLCIDAHSLWPDSWGLDMKSLLASPDSYTGDVTLACFVF